jgi:hypothetical protein
MLIGVSVIIDVMVVIIGVGKEVVTLGENKTTTHVY